MEHECKHEVDLALISQRIDQILANQIKSASKQEIINNIIFGNGKAGLRTEIIRNRDAIKRQWYALGVIIAGLSGLAFYALR